MLVAAAPSLARADGLEFAGAGARGTMRGGAYVVGSDDAMALLYNPANLATVHGMQLHASVGLLFYSSCYQQDGTYGFGPGQYGVDRGGSDSGVSLIDNPAYDPLTDYRNGSGNQVRFSDVQNVTAPEVCNSHSVNVVPQLSYAWRISERLGIGIGLVAPTAPGNLSFGSNINGREGMVRTADGSVLPSPARYQLVNQNALIAFPTIGMGVNITDKLRVGGSFGWGFGSISYDTFATPFYIQSFGLDIYSQVRVSDAFIPRVAAGISGGPWAGVSFGAAFTYYGDLGATGTLRAQSMYGLDAATRAMGVSSATIGGVSLGTPLPWQANLGVRYASIRDGVTLPEGAIGDSLDTERWNIEGNFGFTKSSRVHEFAVGLGNVPIPRDAMGNVNTSAYPCALADPNATSGPGCITPAPGIDATVPYAFPAPVRHNWKDQITLRVGGDYNAIPGRLSVSGGVSYDSNGQQRGYEQLDFQPYRRVGLHTGFTVRINRWDVFVAYAHHFNQQRTVDSLTACTGTRVVGGDFVNPNGTVDPGERTLCDSPPSLGGGLAVSDDDWGLHPLAVTSQFTTDVVNSGRFRSHLDVLQVGTTYHFR